MSPGNSARKAGKALKTERAISDKVTLSVAQYANGGQLRRRDSFQLLPKILRNRPAKDQDGE